VRLLLDTHAWFWWMMGSSRLASRARDAIADPANEALISPASVSELICKVRAGILPEMARLAENVEEEIDGEGFGRLPISTRHAARAAMLVGAHPDPFDRILIAQAQIEDIALVSNERRFDAFGVRRLWDR